MSAIWNSERSDLGVTIYRVEDTDGEVYGRYASFKQAAERAREVAADREGRVPEVVEVTPEATRTWRWEGDGISRSYWVKRWS